MDSGAGEDAPKSPAPPQQSSKAVEPSAMVKKKENGSGGEGDAPSTSSAVAGAMKGAPSKEQIARMAASAIKGQNNKRGSKKNGHNNHPTEPAVSSSRGGGRGGHVPRNDMTHNPQQNNQRSNNRKPGNWRDDAQKPGNTFPDRDQHEPNSSRSNPFRGYQNGGHGVREPIDSCVAKFLDRPTQPKNVTNVPIPNHLPPEVPVPKPRQARTKTLLSQNEVGGSGETSSLLVTPKPVPKPDSTSSTQPVHENTTPPHPTSTTVTKPSLSSSSSSCERQSGTPLLLQLMEEHERNKSAFKSHSMAAKKPEHRSMPARSPRSMQNGMRNYNDPRAPRVPPGIIEQQKNLPIYSVKGELMELVRKHPVIIVIGDPGSGKSTQLPQYLMEAGFSKNGRKRIGVTEPRRVAAKTLAERVAYEVGQPVGSTVGYTVRFERKMSKMKTVIKFMTDGVLVQECADKAHLEEYSVVIIDEAHERSVHTDICFGLLKREAERAGSKLKIIISSATLEEEKFSEYFGGAPVFHIPGRNTYEPKIIHEWEENYLQKAVKTIQDINQKDNYPKGDILVFLSGQDEIEELTGLLYRGQNEISRPDSQLQIVQCYGALTFNEQMKIFDPAPENCRKVILSTNIAETSITIEGVVYVIDCGYFKESYYNPVNGINYLVKKRITKPQAFQRLGRASRVEQGMCFRLYSEEDFEKMDEAGVPEITRCNLESTILDLAAMGITGWDFSTSEDKIPIKDFDLMDLPTKNVIIEALSHLNQLSAIKFAGTGFEITKLGELMASFHLDPSLSRVLIESTRLGCAQESLKIVALLSANYSNMFYGHSVAKDTLEKFYHPDGDLLTFLNMYNAWLENGKKVEWCKAHSLQHRVFQEAEDIRSQISSILKRLNDRNPQETEPTSCPTGTLHENIRKSFVAGYFRQFAFKKPRGPAYRHLANVAAPEEDVYLHPSSVFCNCDPPTPPQWIIYIAMMVTSKPYMRAATVIDPEWIWDYAPKFAENLAKLNVLAPQGPPQYQEDGNENDARRLALEC